MQANKTGGNTLRRYLPPLGGVFSTVETGNQEEEQTNKKVVEGEDLCHHGPLPAQPGHGEQPSCEHCTGTWTRQPDGDGGGAFT